MAKSRSGGSSIADSTPSPEDYAAFVGQIELTEIWLRSLKVENPHGAATPDRASIQVDDDASWEETEQGFRALQHYHLRFQTPNALLAEIEATFGLEFVSTNPMTEPFFSVFRDINLPVNSWPYLRELVATTMGRMGWVAATLPTIKVGTSAPDRSATQNPARTRTRKRAKPLVGNDIAQEPHR